MLQGYAQLMLGALVHGAPGTDFAMASLLPAHFVRIYESVALHGDLAMARQAYDRLLPLFRLMEKYDITRMAKALAPMFNLELGPHREPVLPLAAGARAEIHRVVAEIGPA